MEGFGAAFALGGEGAGDGAGEPETEFRHGDCEAVDDLGGN